jgi:hypothetical protein
MDAWVHITKLMHSANIKANVSTVHQLYAEILWKTLILETFTACKSWDFWEIWPI